MESVRNLSSANLSSPMLLLSWFFMDSFLTITLRISPKPCIRLIITNQPVVKSNNSVTAVLYSLIYPHVARPAINEVHTNTLNFNIIYSHNLKLQKHYLVPIPNPGDLHWVEILYPV